MQGRQEIKEALQLADSIAVNDRPRRIAGRISVRSPFREDQELRYHPDGLWTIGRPIPTNDVWIAAGAMQYGLTILTTDAHFTHIAQVLVHHVDIT